MIGLWSVLTGWGGVAPVAFALILLFDLGLLFWQIQNLQRAGDAYVAGHGTLSRIWGGYLVALLVIFASLSAWWGLYLASFAGPPEENFADKMDRMHAEQYALSVSPSGGVLRFEGTITHGLTRRAQTLMADHPGLHTLHLNSAGGHVYEARGFAGLIRDAGLDTLAVGDCVSTCTLLFIAGEGRRLGAQGRLGFHQYALQGESPILNLDPAGEQDKDRAFFRAQGVEAAFTQEMFATPSRDMWFPSRMVLEASGVVTK